MAVWNRLKSLNVKQLFMLVKTFGGKPRYFFPTHRATIKTIQICDDLFKKAHHKNNETNAFRHGLWNILIAKKCFAKNNSVEKSVAWAKTITDLHEKLAPNSELEMTMDLHNNEIGRILFAVKQLEKMENESIITVLKEKMKTAVKVSSIDEIEEHKREFVYLEDLKTK